MTLEERVDKFEEAVGLIRGAMEAMTKGGIQNAEGGLKLCERVTTLEGQVRDLDVMVLSIRGMLEETLEILKA